MGVEIVVAESADAAAHAAAELLAEIAGSDGHVALAGGSTPRLAYGLAATAQPDWSRVEIWLGDERCVPVDDERANARLVREALLERLAVPPRATHFVRTELPAAAAAAAYDTELREVRLSLALLGLGPDGHTASLFPNAPSLDERGRLAVAAAPGLPPCVERVTMTIPAFAGAHHVVFLAVGADKAKAVHRAFAEPPSPTTPASLVRSARGRTTAIVDREAAARLG